MNHRNARKIQEAVPCGNPKRYETRDVVRMPQSRKHKLDDVDNAETESEKHLQTLLQRQIKKDISITDQFSQHRNFTPATSHAPEVEKLVGVHKYEDYKHINDMDSKIEYLRQCNLDDEEIALKLREELSNKESIPVGGYGADPESRLQKLKEIERKIQEKEKLLQMPDKFHGALELSRQAQDLEKRLGKESKHPNVIITQRKFKDSHPDDPINHIQKILKQIEEKKERESRRERRKKRKFERRQKFYAMFNEPKKDETDSSESDNRNTERTTESLDFGPSLPSETSDVINLVGETTQNSETVLNNDSDSVHVLNNEVPLPSVAGNVTQTCKEIKTPVTFLTQVEIENNRLSLDEIKALDKFQNYSRGEPNRVVYVKNLPNKVKEEDLIALFGRFQSENKPRIIFKLLAGKMKGQAFITFPDEETAEKAIELVNGYKLHEKPVILTFGRKKV
ncbi:RNA-binding protein 41-like [Physella acuta]|uniref:RNA-binding protein 41-like n=1 Tax=Physella acuta TaxID=109671 RepID=UPI0027DEAABD|nr:RNA-binding protein 41-like [Physella acuta]XP_059149603.1 RNA-binding protein 41-like [Physella acuta]